VRNTAEVVGKVGVYDIRMPAEHQLFHLGHCLLRVAPRAVRILFAWKIGFEDRFQHQHRCCHADPIPQGRDAQRPEFAVGFRYEHAPDRVRPVVLFLERKRQFAKPPLYAILLDIREVLLIHTRRAPIGAAQGVGMGQNILAENLVVQSIEAIVGFSLRFRV
jgi:hypothetical protein